MAPPVRSWLGRTSMIRTLLAISLCVLVSACGRPRTNICQMRAAAMLDMSFTEFDQGSSGWRSLDGSLACADYADDILAEYRSRHQTDLSAANMAFLKWHEAQVVASQGNAARAVILMQDAAFSEEPDWQRLYREGSIAFLSNDLIGLKSARDKLAALPQDPSLTANGEQVVWPPNLDVLDGLISCFGQPYSAAYSCRAREPV